MSSNVITRYIAYFAALSAYYSHSLENRQRLATRYFYALAEGTSDFKLKDLLMKKHLVECAKFPSSGRRPSENK